MVTRNYQLPTQHLQSVHTLQNNDVQTFQSIWKVKISWLKNNAYLVISQSWFYHSSSPSEAKWENNNLLLTERKARTGEYWPGVVPVQTEGSEVRTKWQRANIPQYGST